MSKFNAKASVTSKPSNNQSATRNREGGLAFKLSPHSELMTTVLGTFLESRQYESGNTTMSRIDRLVKSVVASGDAEFIWQLAAQARKVWNLRSVSTYLAVLAAEQVACRPYVRKWLPVVMARADEPVEFLALWVSRNGHVGNRGKGKPFPNSVKKAMNDIYNSFSEYTVEKYFKNNMTVKHRDLISICHMKPKDEKQAAIFKYLFDETINSELLPLIEAKRKFATFKTFNQEAKALVQQHNLTWEVVASQFGGKNPEVWDSLNIPFMAGLRNLRNILESGADVSGMVKKLKDENEVRRSKQLPFRFFSALKSIENIHTVQANRVRNALHTAMDLSVANIEKFPGISLAVADTSGSMRQPVSKKGTIMCDEIACLFAGMANHLSEDGLAAAFATNYTPVVLSSRDSIMTNAGKVKSANVGGYQTNAWKTFEYLIKNKIHVDRVFLFSDMQCYGGGWDSDRQFAPQFKKYLSSVNPNCKLYSVDLAGLGTAQVPEDNKNVVLLSGFSERIFDYVRLFEGEKETLLDTIKSLTPEIFAR